MREHGYQLFLSFVFIVTGIFGAFSPANLSGKDSVTEQVSADSKLIALTFDDGPGAYTDELLDKLEESGVTATFFLLGNCAERYPGTVRRIAELGHEIGVHSYSHPTLTRMSAYNIRREISRTVDAIQAAVPDCKPVVFRPPGGAYNTTVRNVCAEFDMSLILWSVDTKDWQSRNADKIYNAVFASGSYGANDGSIILMHDIHKASVASIDRIIERLKSEGYTFVTVSQLLELRCGGASPGSVYSQGKRTG